MVETQAAPQPPTRSTKDLAKVAASGWLGTAMEFMDFQLYSLAAALVFNKIFFPDVNPAVGLIASMATYGVGYVARLVGAIYFGRMGDRIGRKKVLYITIALMGLSTTLIGVLPTYAQVGLLAPILPLGGGLNLGDPEVRADLDGRHPLTAIGRLATGLLLRCERGLPAPSIVSCDNLPANGALLQRVVSEYAGVMTGADGSRLTEYLTGVRFPSTMVDRMVPATTDADRDEVARLIGFRDEAAVVAEPFRQWVIEDTFTSRRPAWERAGAVFVADVHPWESAKLQLLNATHSLVAYLGLAAGLPTIAAAVEDVAFGAAAARLMTEDVLPILDLPDGLNATDYCDSVVRRFANPALGHTTAKVGADGSQKLGPRLLSTAGAARRAGRVPRWAALAVAAWMWHVAHR